METTTRTLPDNRVDVDTLNSLLRGEISAVETYEQAIEKFSKPEDRRIANVLTRVRDEHSWAVTTLRERVLAHGGIPSDGAGVWGVFAKAVEGAAKLLGPQTALSALKQGETHGQEEYEKAVANADLSVEARMLILNDLLTRCRSHIDTLEQLNAQLEQK
jgi:uncharacterized protein (TIGR02284 family)